MLTWAVAWATVKLKNPNIMWATLVSGMFDALMITEIGAALIGSP